MAQLLVRNLDDDVKARLKARAARHGRSLEAEVREVLRAAAAEHDEAPGMLGTRIAALFKDCGFTREEAEALELRGYEARVPDFGE